jgi:hypothetical protein
MFATLLLFTGYLACQLGSLAHGNGRRRETMTDETAQIGLMVSLAVLLRHQSPAYTELSTGSSANSSIPWQHQC